MFILTILCIWLPIVHGECESWNYFCKGIEEGINQGRKLLEDELLGSLGDAIKDVLDPSSYIKKIPDIATKATKIPDILDDTVKMLELLQNNPLDIAKNIDSEVKDLRSTLTSCIDEFKPLSSAGDIFDPILDIIPESIIDIDHENIFFTLLAIKLLPFKSQVEDVCNNMIQDIIDAIKGITDMANVDCGKEYPKCSPAYLFCRYDIPISDDSSCDNDGFCTPEAPDYACGTEYFHMIAGNIILEGPHLYTTPEIMQHWRIASFVLDLFYSAAKDICGLVLSSCEDPLEGSGCIAAMVCDAVLIVISPVLKGIEYVIDSAEFHDGNVIATQLQSIFDDRVHIINNQLALRDDNRAEFELSTNNINAQFVLSTDNINEKFNLSTTNINDKFTKLYEWLDDKFDNVFQNLDHLEEISKTVQGQRKNVLAWEPDEIDAPYARNEFEQPKIMNNEPGFVVIKLNLIDLCIFGAGFILIMMMVLIILFKYFNVNNQKTSNHRLEYSHSEAEHINK